jgi:hypothetical protein
LPGPGAAASVSPLLEESDRHDVDERVALVGRVEDELAADGRDADAVAVAADAAHDAVDEVPGPRVGRVAEAERVEDAIGRAPIVKMSRRMPPTPVAAPWYGSTADGWLCDSILKATASPSPIEMTPAFSPGPATTSSPAVGSVRRSGFELLYEQCSLHMTLNIASSRSFGSRPPSLPRIASELVIGQTQRRWSGSSGRTGRLGHRGPAATAPIAATRSAALSTSERMIPSRRPSRGSPRTPAPDAA